MPLPLVLRGISHKYFSPPDRPVRAVPRTVQNEADGRSLPVVFKQTGGKMGVVVLDGELFQPRGTEGLFCDGSGDELSDVPL